MARKKPSKKERKKIEEALERLDDEEPDPVKVSQSAGVSKAKVLAYLIEKGLIDEEEAKAEKKGKKGKKGDPSGGATGKMLKLTQQEVSEEAVAQYEDIVMLGRHVWERYSQPALAYGMDVPGYLDMIHQVFDRYGTHIMETEKAMQELRAYASELEEYVDPQFYRFVILREMLTASAATGHPINPNQIKAAMDIVDVEMQTVIQRVIDARHKTESQEQEGA